MKPLSELSNDEMDASLVDMSPAAIDERLNMVAALYDLGKLLENARPLAASDQIPNTDSDEGS